MRPEVIRVRVGTPALETAEDIVRWRLEPSRELVYPHDCPVDHEARAVGQIFDTIRQLVAEDKYLVGAHAAERLDERGIMEWQAVAGLEDGELLDERPGAVPNPAVEVRESLPDGTEFKAVWALLRQSGVAKLVTVHFFDGG